MKILQWTQRFLGLGISVIPLWHKSKGPMIAWEGYIHNPPTEYQLLCWFASGWNNYGVVAGWCNLAFLDFDDFEIFALWKSYIELMHLPMPFTVLSSRGAHVYISLAERCANQRRRGVDVKFHGYVVGPGSVHPDGTMYTAINTQYGFVKVDNLDTILPVELFPHVAPAACGPMQPMTITPTQYSMDPFAAAGMDLISKVKAAVRIESFFADLRKTSADGRWFATVCPFHNDAHPSAWIDIKRQLFGCNVCGMKPLDVINIFSRMHNIPESAAVVQMARAVGVWS
jgi:hypothetical protein